VRASIEQQHITRHIVEEKKKILGKDVENNGCEKQRQRDYLDRGRVF
jgi:hypothetical protein